MANRFSRLYELPPCLYSVGSPVIVSAGALLKDTQTGSVVVQLKYQSVSEMTIKALRIDVVAYDISGKQIQGMNNYQYLDLSIANGQSFGSNKAIVMPDLTTRSFSIEKLNVIFDNGTEENVKLPLVSLPDTFSLKTQLGDKELVKQYQLATNDEANFVPVEAMELWKCSCGHWNNGASCKNCRLPKDCVFSAYNIDLLGENMNLRLATELADKQREAERKERLEVERKQKIRRISAVATPIIMLLCIFIGITYNKAQHKYDSIAGTYIPRNIPADSIYASSTIADFCGYQPDEYGLGWKNWEYYPDNYAIIIKGNGEIEEIWYVDEDGDFRWGTGKITNATIKEDNSSATLQVEIKNHPEAYVKLSFVPRTGKGTYVASNPEAANSEIKLYYIDKQIVDKQESQAAAIKKISKTTISSEMQKSVCKEFVLQGINEVKEYLLLDGQERTMNQYPEWGAEDNLIVKKGSLFGIEGYYTIGYSKDTVFRVWFNWLPDNLDTHEEYVVACIQEYFGGYSKHDRKSNYYRWSKELSDGTWEVSFSLSKEDGGELSFLWKDKVIEASESRTTLDNINYARRFLGRIGDAEGYIDVSDSEYEFLTNDVILFGVEGTFFIDSTTTQGNNREIDIMEWHSNSSISDFDNFVDCVKELYGSSQMKDYIITSDQNDETYKWINSDEYECIFCWQRNDGKAAIRWVK